MKAQKKVVHTCVAEVNKALAKQGDCLQRFIVLKGTSDDKIAVATERANTSNWKRGSAWLMATFCPFCGKKMRP